MENSLIIASVAVGGFVLMKNKEDPAPEKWGTSQWIQFIRDKAANFFNLAGGGIKSAASSFRQMFESDGDVFLHQPSLYENFTEAGGMALVDGVNSTYIGAFDSQKTETDYQVALFVLNRMRSWASGTDDYVAGEEEYLAFLSGDLGLYERYGQARIVEVVTLYENAILKSFSEGGKPFRFPDREGALDYYSQLSVVKLFNDAIEGGAKMWNQFKANSIAAQKESGVHYVDFGVGADS